MTYLKVQPFGGAHCSVSSVVLELAQLETRGLQLIRHKEQILCDTTQMDWEYLNCECDSRREELCWWNVWASLTPKTQKHPSSWTSCRYRTLFPPSCTTESQVRVLSWCCGQRDLLAEALTIAQNSDPKWRKTPPSWLRFCAELNFVFFLQSFNLLRRQISAAIVASCTKVSFAFVESWELCSGTRSTSSDAMISWQVFCASKAHPEVETTPKSLSLAHSLSNKAYLSQLCVNHTTFQSNDRRRFPDQNKETAC